MNRTNHSLLYHFSLIPLCVLGVYKLVDEVYLAFRGYLGGHVGAHDAILGVCALSNKEEALLNVPLHRLVILSDIAFLSKPLIESLLAYLITILADEFGKVTNNNI